MTVQTQRQQAARERLAKKPKKLVVSDGSFLVIAASRTVFHGKSLLLSHNKLRSRTLRNHLGKLYKPHASRSSSATLLEHGVELTDDVIIRDRNGRRVPTPVYATLRIDQLPQFQKG